MGRLRSAKKKIEVPVKHEAVKRQLTAYRATRLWNQVVNGFKRFMPLKTHRVLFQSFENSFKREDALRWLVDFVRETELLRPISLENAAVLLDKLIQLNIISQVSCSKSWLRSPTILYQFTSHNQRRVEKLRSLRYFSRTPQKGTPDLKCTPPAPAESDTPPMRSHPPLCVNDKENILPYTNSPRLPATSKDTHVGKSSSRKSISLRKKPQTRRESQQMCTPCKQRHSIKIDPVFSSTPKDKNPPFFTEHVTDAALDSPYTRALATRAALDSPYTRALATIKSSQRVTRNWNKGGGVKRLQGSKGKKGLLNENTNVVIEGILDEFDDLIAAIDQNNAK